MFTRKKGNYLEAIEQTGYTKKYNDTLVWSFKAQKKYLIINLIKKRLEMAIIGSPVNEEFNARKLIIYEISGQPLTWYNYDILFAPKDGQEYSFKAIANEKVIEFKAKPVQILKKKRHVNWPENNNINTDLAKCYWEK